MVPLGTKAPDFSLIEPATGQIVSLSDFQNQALLVMFVANHCPFVQHIWNKLIQVTTAYLARGLTSVAICVSDVNQYPADGPETIKLLANQIPFRYLYDVSQLTAKKYQAICTPDFFLYNSEHKLVYRGCFDTSSPGMHTPPVTGINLSIAVDALLSGTPISVVQTPSIGCSIKWMPDNEPYYVQRSIE